MNKTYFYFLSAILFGGFAALFTNKTLIAMFAAIALLFIILGVLALIKGQRTRKELKEIFTTIESIESIKSLFNINEEEVPTMDVRFKKIDKEANTPVRSHDSDAGYDLSPISIKTDDMGNIVYGTGLAVEIPKGYAGFVFLRSSVAEKDLFLTNCVGIIDSGYRGEILAKFKPLVSHIDKDDISCYKNINTLNIYQIKERFLQIIIMPVPSINFIEVNELSPSDRGEGGYGSSNK